MRLITLTLIFCLLNACAVYPKFDKGASNQCEVFTRQLTLDMAIAGNNACNSSKNGGELLVCLGLSGVFFVASAVISGSVVVIGNTVNFLEQQGRCEESFLRTQTEKLSELYRD